MSDRYQSLIHTPVGQLLAKNLGPPQPGPPRALHRGRTAGHRHGRRRRRRTARQVRGDGPRRARHLRRAGRRGRGRRRPEVQGSGLRRHRDHLLGRARGPPGVLHPAAAQPRDLPADRRARHSPGVHELRRGAGRPACSGGVHPFAGQGGRPRRHRPARVRRTRRRRRARLHAGVPALAEVGLRLRPGGPDRLARRDRGRRGGRGLDPSAGRQGGDRHRRQSRHRRADRPRPPPRRRDDPRDRRTSGGQRAAGRHG